MPTSVNLVATGHDLVHSDGETYKLANQNSSTAYLGTVARIWGSLLICEGNSISRPHSQPRWNRFSTKLAREITAHGSFHMLDLYTPERQPQTLVQSKVRPVDCTIPYPLPPIPGSVMLIALARPDYLAGNDSLTALTTVTDTDYHQ